MSTAPHPGPIPERPTELSREMFRRRRARRRATVLLAVAAAVVSAATVAGTQAVAATPDLGSVALPTGGHLGHAGLAASLSSDADRSASAYRNGEDQGNGGSGYRGRDRNGSGRNGSGRDDQGQNGQGQNGQGQNGQGQNGQGQTGQGQTGQGQDGQGRDGQGRDGQGRDGQGRDGQGRDGQGQNGQGQNGQGQNGQGQNGQGQNGQNGQGQNGQGQNGQNGQGQTGQGQNGQGKNDPVSNTNGLDVLARDCRDSRLTPHTGFQIAPACVATAFGEVAAAENDPSLLITDAPRETRVGEAFTLKVSTRNLVRDRFLGAAAGGYYLESSVLNSAGLQRGHFHTACRMLTSTNEAPESGPAPAFFVATQDNGGGAQPDTVTINVTGMPSRGVAQCTSWAGDGSHRVPMMQRANQTPAIDSVRIIVR